MVAHGASRTSEGGGDDDQVGVGAGGRGHRQWGGQLAADLVVVDRADDGAGGVVSWPQTWWLLIALTMVPVPASGEAVVQGRLQPGWNSA